jgi:hypothetical protein
MSTTNENILKSLAVLEQNLKDINSAKEQVNNVVKTSGNLAKAIESYQASFESLSINVKDVLEDSRKFNLDSIAKLSEQTKNFSKEIAKLSEFDVSKSLKSIENEAIKQFQQNLSKPLDGLEKQTKNIEKEVAKLTEFDFQSTFSKIEKEVVSQFNVNLKEKLISLDNKALDLQSKIDEFKVQVLRIEKFNLESHFNEMLTTLTNHADKRHIELSKKHEELKSQGNKIFIRHNQQDKEIKTLKTLLFITIGIVIIGVILNILR